MAEFKVKIRNMEKGDLDAVEAIEVRSFGEHHWSKDSFANELNNGYAHYFVALSENGEVMGYMGLWHILDEAHFSTLSVSPDFRGKYVGEALFNRLVRYCYDNMVKYITLEVRVSNGARHLYEKYGMKTLGTRKGYYQDNNEDAYIMWTENIFYDKYKELFAHLSEELAKKVDLEIL